MSRATRRCSSGIRFIGMIFAAWTMAESSPASTASCRKTELSTTRAAGARPKDTLETPRVVFTSGWSRLISRMALIVSSASRRVSSCPVPIGKVRVSTRMSPGRRPQVPVRSSISRLATRTFHSAVRAWPSSSMVRATTAAPCSLTIGITLASRESGPSPSS
ncbi:hypothetical protein SDC9_132368 [bioreactor metagenome]|uniref:Uncharacterized protein n=1 Tax=bioreactor metagenome TaxID=1076179 RepID=A0A645D6Y9_9ZZZZ